MSVIGVDIGGTFTDLVGYRDGAIVTSKTSTVPADPTEGIATALSLAGCDLAATDELIHGSTIAINTVLEHKGARTALITTEGMRDVYAIGRGNRPDAFNLFFHRPRPLVPRELTFEVGERMNAAGGVLRPLDLAEVETVAGKLAALGIESVAVCFLHGYANPAHEIAAGDVLRRKLPSLFVTLSHEILREFREYERTSTTVLNAFVGPRVSRYLSRLEDFGTKSRFAGQIAIMRSNGGTMSVGEARRAPVAMMESGPVAGMIGAGRIAQILGIERAIGFDMGGTTAKTSLITEGVPPIEEGYVIGDAFSGQPMQLPVVDIVEVGTGGGSIAWCDERGGLHVGPQSAGADPGPACYGRTGTEPAVTDADLVLGRLNDARFLGGHMRLDRARAAAAVDKVGGRLGLDTVRAALGIATISDSAMSLAVRAVSVKRGIDPRETTMIAFGGAGPLHACAIAREISIPKVVIPKFPGAFSALGMLMAEWRQDFVRTLIGELGKIDATVAATAFAELRAAGDAALARDRLSGGQFNFAADLRYRGQEHTIPIAVADAHDVMDRTDGTRGQFDAQHDRRYGHAAPDQSIEIVNLRLVVTVPRMQDVIGRWLSEPWKPEGEGAEERRPVVFDDAAKPLDTRILWRPHLATGAEIEGPALIEEANTTTLILPGDRAVIDAYREYRHQPAGRCGPSMTIDPITVEVVRNAVNAYADEMATALCKSAYNMMIYEVRDFCCGLIDSEGRMISQNQGGLPIFLADLGIAVKDGIARYGLDGFAPGDVVIMNHGEVCGQHLNNIVIYAPCFHEGKVVAFAASRAHWVDIGGSRVGFGSVETTEIYQEGIQFRSLKIYEAGKRNETLWQIINDNVRFPEAALGDLRAQIACCQLGGRRYGELLHRYGRDIVGQCIAAVWDATERDARAFVAKIPDGTYEAESFLDNDGRSLDVMLRLKVRVKIDGEHMTVDFSQINGQTAGPINSGFSGGLAAARVAFKCLTQPNAPVNEGCFRPLEVILPEGKILNAKPPAALGLWSIALPSVIDTILKALAPVLPERIPAAHKGDMGGCSISGYKADGRRYLLMNIFGGGWGGRPHEDGESASVSICQGDVRSAPIELQEIQYPFLVERFALRPDSGGAGEHRGGLGVEMTYKALQPCVANVNCERTKDAPWGLRGGKPGAVNVATLIRHDGSEQNLKKATGVKMEPGDRLTFGTAGGGGWGDPHSRPRDVVADDVRAGYVSAEAAKRDYGAR